MSVAADDRALATLLDALPDAVLLIDGEGRLQWANRAAERVFGHPLAEWLGESGLALVHPDDVEMVLLSLTSVQEKEVGTPIEIRLRTAGGFRLMELIGTPVPSVGEGRIVLSLRDLTDRRRYELAHNQEARARAVIHHAAAITMLVRPDGLVDTVSGALTRCLGHDQERIEGRPLTDLVPEAGRPAVTAALDRAARGATTANPVTVDTTLLRRQGDPLPFELTLVNLVDDPTVQGFVVSGHDMTARARAESELQRALSLLTATLDATQDGIVAVDRDGRVASFNNRFVELWKVPETLLSNPDAMDAMRGLLGRLRDPSGLRATVRRLTAHPEAESSDLLTCTDGRVFECSSRPQTVDGAVVGRVWSFRDVTDRKQLEDRLSFQAFHDPLTGLGNRALFLDRLRHAMARSDRTGGSPAVLYLDLDGLKAVNDSLGHVAGDLLLQQMADVLTRCLRKGDTAARLGGDEFGIILEELDGPDEAVALATRILEESRRGRPAGKGMSSSASIGITFARAGVGNEQLLSEADAAMYAAKAAGKDRYAVFDHAGSGPVVAAR